MQVLKAKVERESLLAMRANLDKIKRQLPDAATRYSTCFRRPDGSRTGIPKIETLYFLFRAYLQYMQQRRFKYTLMAADNFWNGSPTGNCQTVASNLVNLLWAFGFEPENLGTEVVSVSHPKNEKVVNKRISELNLANVSGEDAELLGSSKGCRSYRVNRTNGQLEPLTPPRSPFIFHVYTEVTGFGYYKFFDARNGYKYLNGATDMFEGWERLEDLECNTQPSGISLASLARMLGIRQKSAVFASARRPLHRIYELPESFSKHPVVAAAMGDYNDGGNWIFSDERDWSLEMNPGGLVRSTVQNVKTAPDHILRMLSTSPHSGMCRELAPPRKAIR